MPGVLLVLDGASSSAGFVVLSAAAAAVDAHLSVTNVVGAETSTVGAVDWNLIVVGSEAVAVSIGVVEKSSLEHFVVRWFDTWHEVGWSEGNLLSLCVEVLRVAVEYNLAYGFQGVVGVGPDLGHIVDIKTVSISVGDGHNLDKPVPGGGAAIEECLVQVTSGEVLVLHTFLGGFSISEVFDALGSLEVVLNQESLPLGIDPLEGV